MAVTKRYSRAEAARDRKAYSLATAYLMSFRSQGITREILECYLKPQTPEPRGMTMADVYHRLLVSAQNAGMIAKVIGRARVDSLRPVLGDFDPSTVLKRFTSSDELFQSAVRSLKRSGKLQTQPGTLWNRFSQAAYSGARFLSQFSNAADFVTWANTFDNDARKRAALPLLVAQEVDGFGFALACDFLKEIGFINFAKPDVHVKAIVKGLLLCPAKASDYIVFKTVARIAENCSSTAYAVDKVFWLVGSGKFYLHKTSIGKRGRIGTNRDRFIHAASKSLVGTA